MENPESRIASLERAGARQEGELGQLRARLARDYVHRNSFRGLVAAVWGLSLSLLSILGAVVVAFGLGL